MNDRDRADLEADYVVVGSGAGGATVSMMLAEAGRSVLVLEEGDWHRRESFSEDLYGAMRALLRDFGAQAARGRSFIPVLEGRCVGGSTVVNGAIVHRLPREVHAVWCRDAGIREALPFPAMERCAERIERDLGIGPNLAPLLDGLPASSVLGRLGWRHQAMARNAKGCRSTGRCLQGCPSGGKLSMENSYIPRAVGAGARVFAGHRVERVWMEDRRAAGVLARLPDGGSRVARARKGVILSAGTVQSPRILARSGLAGALRHLGRHFQCHLGVGVTGLLDRPVRSVEGPPQGIEILQFAGRGIRLATQLLPPELILARAPVVGGELADLLKGSDRIASWTVSVRSGAEGLLKGGWGAGSSIRYTPCPADVEKLREGAGHLSRLLFELGARRVWPGVAAAPAELRSAGECGRLDEAPLDPRAWPIVVGHIFGTCRMGSNPAASVVGPRFQVHGVEGLYVMDASVFPTNLGVNPQHAVMTLAMRGAQMLLESEPV